MPWGRADRRKAKYPQPHSREGSRKKTAPAVHSHEPGPAAWEIRGQTSVKLIFVLALNSQSSRLQRMSERVPPVEPLWGNQRLWLCSRTSHTVVPITLASVVEHHRGRKISVRIPSCHSLIGDNFRSLGQQTELLRLSPPWSTF